MAAIAQMSHCTGPRRMGAGTAGEEGIGSGQASTSLRAHSRSGSGRVAYNAVDDLDKCVELSADLVHGDRKCCEFLVRALLCFVGAFLCLGKQDLRGEEHLVFLAELDVVVDQQFERALDAIQTGCSV